jgi:hypothetical protein
MNFLSRVAFPAVLAVALLIPAGLAQAESIQVNLPDGSFVYFEGNQEGMGGNGKMFICRDGVPTGGYYEGGSEGGQYGSDDECPAPADGTRVVEAPGGFPPEGFPPGGGETPELPPEGFPPGGGGDGFPCSGPDCPDVLLQECLDSPFAPLCEALAGGEPPEFPPEGFPPGGDGGGGAPAPGGRECTSSNGGAATCIDFDAGNYLVLDPPDDGHGELGFCTDQEQAPDGPGYYFASGPSPDGGKNDACPGGAAAPAPAPGGGEGEGGETPPPPPDGDGDGAADSNDRCPATAGSGPDGCPEQPAESTSEPAPTGESTTPPPASRPAPQQRPAQPVERPRVEVTRSKLRVSRRGRLSVPLACRSARTRCTGDLLVTASRRTASGRVVRVVVARATFDLAAGAKASRRVRLTKAGRRMLANSASLRGRARTVLLYEDGRVERRERLVLRRR